MFTTFAQNFCSQLLFKILLLKMFITFVHNIGPEHNFCSQLWHTICIHNHNICSQLLFKPVLLKMFLNFVPKFCSQFGPKLFYKKCCSNLLFTSLVLFTTLDNNFSSKLLFITIVQHCIHSHSVGSNLLITPLMLITFDHDFSYSLGSQVLVNNFCSQSGIKTLVQNFWSNIFLITTSVHNLCS